MSSILVGFSVPFCAAVFPLAACGGCTGYFVDEQKAAAFDALFPPKEELELPGQLF